MILHPETGREHLETLVAEILASARRGWPRGSDLAARAPRKSSARGTPLGLAAAKPLLSASSVYAFSDHSPIVATFEV